MHIGYASASVKAAWGNETGEVPFVWQIAVHSVKSKVPGEIWQLLFFTLTLLFTLRHCGKANVTNVCCWLVMGMGRKMNDNGVCTCWGLHGHVHRIFVIIGQHLQDILQNVFVFYIHCEAYQIFTAVHRKLFCAIPRPWSDLPIAITPREDTVQLA